MVPYTFPTPGLGNCPPPSGADGTGQMAGTIGASAAAASVGIAVAAGTITAATGGLLAPIAPLIGLALNKLFTPDYCKIDTSNAANEIASQMQANLAQWRGLPANQKCASVQAYYLANYDALWQSLVNICGNPMYGDAGKNCLIDRQPGGRWDDARYNRDPIANDPEVLTDAQCLAANGASAVGAVDSATGGAASGVLNEIEQGGYMLPLLLIGLAFFL